MNDNGGGTVYDATVVDTCLRLRKEKWGTFAGW